MTEHEQHRSKPYRLVAMVVAGVAALGLGAFAIVEATVVGLQKTDPAKVTQSATPTAVRTGGAGTGEGSTTFSEVPEAQQPTYVLPADPTPVVSLPATADGITGTTR